MDKNEPAPAEGDQIRVSPFPSSLPVPTMSINSPHFLTQNVQNLWNPLPGPNSLFEGDDDPHKVNWWRDKCVRERLGYALAQDTLHKDVVFIVGENRVRISAHKLILRLSSLVFENLLSAHEERGLTEVLLPNATPEMFLRLLKFIYTDELEIQDFFQFSTFAKDFGFTRLAEQSMNSLIGGEVTERNAVFVLDISSRMADTKLEESTLEFIRKNATVVLESAGFVHVSYFGLCQIILDDGLCTDELTIFRAILKWARYRCVISAIPLTGVNIREILQEARFFIRYTEMPYDQLITEVRASEILNASEYIQILKTFIDPSENPFGIPTKPRRIYDNQNYQTSMHYEYSPPQKTSSPKYGQENITSEMKTSRQPRDAFSFSKDRNPKSTATINQQQSGTPSSVLSNSEKRETGPTRPTITSQASPAVPKMTEPRTGQTSEKTKRTDPYLFEMTESLKNSQGTPKPTQKRSKRRLQKHLKSNNTRRGGTKRKAQLELKENENSQPGSKRRLSKKCRKSEDNLYQMRYAESHLVDYGDVLSAIEMQTSIQHIGFENVVFLNTMAAKEKRIYLPDLKSFIFYQGRDSRAKLPDTSFKERLSTKEFLFFEKDKLKPWTFKDLWSLGVEIRVDVKGIRLFYMNPSERKLTLAYPVEEEANQLLNSLPVQAENGLKSLCLIGFNINSPLNLPIGMNLETLVVQDVTFHGKNAMWYINQCPGLRNLSVFIKIGIKVNLACDLTRHRSSLERLAMSNADIMNWSKNTNIVPFSRLQELYLDQCQWTSCFFENCSRLFPNLRKIAVRSLDKCRPSAGFLFELLQLPKLQEIAFFRNSGGNEAGLNPNINIFIPPLSPRKKWITGFLQSAGLTLPLVHSVEAVVPDFILERNNGNGNWRSVLDLSELDEIHFQHSMLHEFFASSSVLKQIK